MERNFFEKLVRENFRFGRMCRDCESTEMNRESARRTWNRKSARRTWNRKSAQQHKENVRMCCRLSAGI